MFFCLYFDLQITYLIFGPFTRPFNQEERLDEVEKDVYVNEVANAGQHVTVLNDVPVDELINDPAKSVARFKPVIISFNIFYIIKPYSQKNHNNHAMTYVFQDVPVKKDVQDVEDHEVVNEVQNLEAPFKPVNVT